MSFLNALGEQESRADQGWTYSNSYNCNTNSNNSNVYNSSPSSIDHWSSPAQHYSLSSASTPTVDNQIQEIKSSDTEDEVLLVDDPALSREEEMLSHSNSMNSRSFHNSYSNHGFFDHISHNHARMVEQLHGSINLSPSSEFCPQSHSEVQQENHMRLMYKVQEHSQQQQHMHQRHEVAVGHHIQHEHDAKSDRSLHFVQSGQRSHLQNELRYPRVEPTSLQHSSVPTGQQQYHPQRNSEQAISGLHHLQSISRDSHTPSAGQDYFLQSREQCQSQHVQYCQSSIEQHQYTQSHDVRNEQRNEVNREQQQYQQNSSFRSNRMHGAQADVRDPLRFQHESVEGGPYVEQHCTNVDAHPQQTLNRSGSIDFQSIPKENFVVVGGTGLQKNMIYHIKSPVVEGHGQMALWDGNNMIPVDPSAASTEGQQFSAGESDVWGGQGHRGDQAQSRNANLQGNTSGLHLTPKHHRPEPSALKITSSNQGGSYENSNPTAENSKPGLTKQVPANQASVHQPNQQGDSLTFQQINSQTINPLNSQTPRFSATNDVWPTPMPGRKSLKHENVKESQPSQSSPSDVQTLSESQSSVDSNIIELSPPIPIQKEDIINIQSDPPQNIDPGSTSSSTDKELDSSNVKRKLAEDEEAVAVCRYCGYSSSDTAYCESCKRKFPQDVKIVIKKRKLNPGGRDGSPASKPEVPAKPITTFMEKKKFYGQKMQIQAAGFGDKQEESSKEISPKKTPRSNRGRRINTGLKGAGRTRRFRDLLKEPVTLTISSDEEEPTSSQKTPNLSSNTTFTPTTPSITTGTSEEDPFGLPELTANKQKIGITYKKSRRERMLDESGHIPTPVKRCTSPVPITNTNQRLITARGVRVGSLRSSAEYVDLLPKKMVFKIKSDRTQEIHDFEVLVEELSSIHYTLSPMQPVFFIKVNPACGVRLRERLKMSQQSPEYFDPGSTDPQKSWIVVIVEEVLNKMGLKDILLEYKKAHQDVLEFLREVPFEEANSLLVKTTPPVLTDADCDNLRHWFQSTGRLKGPRSPASSRLHNHSPGLPISALAAATTPVTIAPITVAAVIVAPITLPPVTSTPITGDTGDSTVIEEMPVIGTPVRIGGDAGLDSPASSSKEEKMPSRSPSPRIGFVGPVEKLLTYPAPPATGGITITNEDLYCLNEGEFLNDVILDFYLKYLLREKLSDQDKQRTHIFSSFFYKRLTQRQSRSLHDSDDTKLTPPQRKHARVKTWTRHVDIFSKDFLLVPINEQFSVRKQYLEVVRVLSCDDENVRGHISIKMSKRNHCQYHLQQQVCKDMTFGCAQYNINLCRECHAPYHQKLSHWFLAVICFPGLNSSEYVPFQTLAATQDNEIGGNGNENKLTSSPAKKEEETPSPSANIGKKDDLLDAIDSPACKTILGKIIEQSKVTDQTKFDIGQKQPCILILDSLAGPSRNSVIKTLKEYLQVEWDLKKQIPRNIAKSIRGAVPKVPQQTNYSDCGVFVLQYAETFFESPIANFSIPMKGLENWFPLHKAEKKREEIRNLILQLQSESR